MCSMYPTAPHTQLPGWHPSTPIFIEASLSTLLAHVSSAGPTWLPTAGLALSVLALPPWLPIGPERVGLSPLQPPPAQALLLEGS